VITTIEDGCPRCLAVGHLGENTPWRVVQVPTSKLAGGPDPGVWVHPLKLGAPGASQLGTWESKNLGPGKLKSDIPHNDSLKSRRIPSNLLRPVHRPVRARQAVRRAKIDGNTSRPPACQQLLSLGAYWQRSRDVSGAKVPFLPAPPANRSATNPTTPANRPMHSCHKDYELTDAHVNKYLSAYGESTPLPLIGNFCYNPASAYNYHGMNIL
jgi:hypothetical protein